MGVVLREVEHSDLNQIQSLFFEVYGKEASDGFTKAFLLHQDLLGYCLIDDSVPTYSMIGYFGCFTYDRSVGNEVVKFYNTHTWIVKPEYRKHSLKLLMPYLSITDGVVTNFSANFTVAPILEKLKFSKILIDNFILGFSFSIKAFFQQFQISSLEPKLEVVKAHENYKCLGLRLRLPHLKDDLEMILKAVDKKPKWVKKINKISKVLIRRPLITKAYFLYKIHYSNYPQTIVDCINILNHFLFLKYKVGGLIMPSSFIAKNAISERIESTYQDEIYVKSNAIELVQIDYLYSEVFYLNIADK